SELEEAWTSVDRSVKFQSTFLNEEIEKVYAYLIVQIKFFSVLSALAITIACLGLLGMVAFTTEHRTKEIAIRKIMGASDKSLFLTLTKDFVKLILIATAIAVPLSYFFYDIMIFKVMLHYGTGIGFMEILLSTSLLFIIGFGLLFGQTSQITRTNPAKNLRHE
ncbi:MAG: FtsX-like permease family protein, partial [Cyclobacteriaceae bacterium]